MKFTKKAFFSIFFIFILFFEGGLFLITRMVYQEDLNRTVTRTVEEHQFLMDAMYRAITDLEVPEEKESKAVLAIFEWQAGFLEGQYKGFELYDGQTLLKSIDAVDYYGKREELEQLTYRNRYTIREIGDRRYVYVAGQFPFPYDRYGVVYIYGLEQLQNSWESITKSLSLAGTVLCVILGGVLLLWLKHLTAPLSRLAEAADEMSTGHVKQMLPVEGNDEVADLTRRFNAMSEKISVQMDTIKEQAEKRQQLIDNLAHEMRTPLTAIYGYTELLAKANLTGEEREEYLQYVLSETKRVQTLADQLLKLAALNQEQVEFQRILAGKFAEQICMTMKPLAESRNIELRSSVSVEYLWGDQELLFMLMVNLMENGLRASADGSILELKVYSEAGRTILEVRDHGVGIPGEELENIFEPFYRIDRARSRRMGGTGLGLALCKKIVECHGGELKYESEVGAGTRAMVILEPEGAEGEARNL